MQWANDNPSFRFSKLPIILCVAVSAIQTNIAFGQEQEIPSTMEVKSEQEAFLVRRIAEFWKDRDFLLVKRQIDSFLKEYPDSPINDQLRGILGDLYLQEQDYEKALAVYSDIHDHFIEEKVIVNRLQCHYELSNYAALSAEGKPYLQIKSKRIGERKNELNFLVAEALFRQALEATDEGLKNELAAEARPLYEQIKESDFSKHSKLALAEIYTILKDYEQSANYYLEIANAYPEQSEELLSQAALAQSEFDPQLAIQTFTHICEMNGPKANEAAVNRLILFFQEEEFDNVIQSYPAISIKEADAKKETLDYIVGRSYFALHNYKESSNYLSKYIDSQKDPSPHLKNALLMQLNCTQQNKDDALCDKTIVRFKEHYSEDSELSQALFIHAMMLKGRNDLAGAEKELAQIVKDNAFEDKESLYLEYGLITHENGKFATSYNTLKGYLTLFPEAEHTNVAWKYYLSSSLNRLKTLDKDQEYSKELFYEDLAAVLTAQAGSGEILNPEEEKDCRLLSAKTAYELKRFAIAANQLETYIQDYPSDPNLSEAHLILGISHQNMSSDPELFYSNIEKALALNPELTDQSSLHLQLYNSYLAKIEVAASTQEAFDDQSKARFYDLAAEHLYKAVKLNDSQIKAENKLWLANHYYLKMKIDDPLNPNKEYVTRAHDLYHPMLVSENQPLSLNNDNIYLEAEILKFAEILSIRNDHQSKMLVLKGLAEQQNRNNTLNWEYQMQTLLELAQVYEVLSDHENALDTYAFIQNASNNEASFINDFATLHASRLTFNLMESDFKNESNEKILGMLNHLKDLSIKKSASSEPLHLEAAIEYAHMRANICDANQKDDRYLFFLKRIKEDYSAMDDPIVQEYHAKLATSTEKKALFETYMAYVDAEILRTEALIEQKNKKAKVAIDLNNQALTKLAQVKGADVFTPYLNDKVQDSIRLIDAQGRR